MRILLDCDGVLCDFATGILKVINHEFGTSYVVNDIDDWDIFKALKLSRTQQAVIKNKIQEKNFCANLARFYPSLDGVDHLLQLGEVFIVTAPLKGSAFWMPERMNWLMQNFSAIDFDHVIFATRKDVISGDVLIDDASQNVISWKKANPKGTAYLWSCHHNKDVVLPADIERVVSWSDLISKIKLLSSVKA